jgi:hypothetical protein
VATQADCYHPDTLAIEDVRVYRHMKEADDCLLFARYNIAYGNLTQQPPYPVTETFQVTYTSEGHVLLASWDIEPVFNMGYNKGLVSFYWSADDPDRPNWGDAGNLTIAGSALFDSPPSVSYILSDTNYPTGTEPSSLREDLRSWLLDQLLFLELDWNNWGMARGYTDKIVDLVGTVSGDYTVASPQGEAYLAIAIPDIKTMCKLLFFLQTTDATYSDLTHTLSQQTIYTDLHASDVVGQAQEGASELLGGMGRIWASTLIVIIAGLAIIGICQTAWQKATCGVIIAFGIILVSTPEGLFHMSLMALFTFICVLGLVNHLFWSRSQG